MECSRCGISEDKADLFEVISREGIMKVCGKCLLDSDMPKVKKKTEGYYAAINKQTPGPSVYSRLSKMSGFEKKDKKIEVLKKQESHLKKIVDLNLEKEMKTKKKRKDLVENFHWIILMARRSKKITQEQMAKEIGEQELTIKMAEQGFIPEGNDYLVKKIERFLGVDLFKERPREDNFSRDLSFNSESTKNLKIADLNKMKEKAGESKEKKSSFSQQIVLDEKGKVVAGDEEDEESDLTEGEEEEKPKKSKWKFW